jgi:histidinol-phosphate aminotransferase
MAITRLIRPEVVEAQAPNFPEGRRDFLRLDSNESPNMPDDELLEAIRHLDRFHVGCYPEISGLRESLARYAGTRPENLLLTNGSTQGIQVSLELFFRAGDQIVIPAPTFPVYYNRLRIMGAAPKTIPYAEDDGKFVFPTENLIAALDESAAGVALCSPNNPLGDAIPADDLLAIAERTRQLDVPLILDEAYAEFAARRPGLTPDEFPNLIVLRTFSKAFGLAGLRLGYVLAAPEVIAEMAKVITPRSVNHVAVMAGLACLSRLPHFRLKIEETVRMRQKTADHLKTVGIQCYPSEANFMVCRHPDKDGLLTRLKNQGILVSDLSLHPYSYGLLKNAFRLSVPAAADWPRFSRALNRVMSRTEA